MRYIQHLFLSFFLLANLLVQAKDYNASLFGIKSDGITDNTGSIRKAIEFISENGGGRLVFYVGRYLTGTIDLKSDVSVHLEEGAILVGVPNVYGYKGPDGHKALILADSVRNSGITGKGVVEGRGDLVREHIRDQIIKGYLVEKEEQAAPALVYMRNCSGITFDQVNLWNACGDVLSFRNCSGLHVSGLALKSNEVPGSRGIVLTGCKNIRLDGLYFDTSGTEWYIDDQTKNITAKNCINKEGKVLDGIL